MLLKKYVEITGITHSDVKNFQCFIALPSQQKLVPRTPPPPTSPGRPLKILFDHPRDVPKWRPGDFLIWCPKNVPGRLIRRTFKARITDDVASFVRCPWIFFVLFFRNLLDWWNLAKSNSILKVYLVPSRTSKMELFCNISSWLLAVNCFREKNFIVKFRLGSQYASDTL